MKLSGLTVCSAVLQFKLKQERDDFSFLPERGPFAQGYDEKAIASLTGLSLDEIRRLKRDLG